MNQEAFEKAVAALAKVHASHLTDATRVDIVRQMTRAVNHAIETAQTAAVWPRYAERYGMKPEWLNKTFRHRTKTFTIVGINPNKVKNNVTLRDQNGKVFIAPPQMVVRGMEGRL